MTEISETLLRPRRRIQELLLQGEVATVLEMAGMLHGHYCPGLALGVKAAYTGFEKLGIRENSGMEEVMAVVECNSCFVDGVQFAAGCTLGNNALVYQDLGKTAVTFYRRGGANAIRLCVKTYDIETGDEGERREGDALFEKAVKRREQLTDNERTRMKELWVRRSFATVVEQADTLFAITPVPVPSFAFAPRVDSQECGVCGEKVMETRARVREGRPVCIGCAGDEYRMVVGTGIVTGGGLCS